MKILTLDVETTGATNGTGGNPFSSENILSYVGYRMDGISSLFDIEYSSTPYGMALEAVRNSINSCDLIVGYNLKFDLNWLARYGIREFLTKRVWDCQLFDYIKSRQTISYPSLDDSLSARGIDKKLDIVRTEYWENGIDTNEVPRSILEEYLNGDLEKTEALYHRQLAEFADMTKEMQSLILINMEDLLFLREIEENGLYYDFIRSEKLANQERDSVAEMDRQLYGWCGDSDINFSSNDHISCWLFGGSVQIPTTETYTFTYKDGRTKEKTRKAVRTLAFPRLIEPLPKSQLAKEGFYKTDIKTLIKLGYKAKGVAGKILKMLIARSKKMKLIGTYYEGFPNHYVKYGWINNLIHGNINQCVTNSGRLSSSKPNRQNMPEPMRSCIISRFQ